MKRTPLKRGKPVARKTRMKQRRATPRRSERVADPAYLAAVHVLDGHIAATRATLFPADTTRPPGLSATSSAASAAGHLSRALEQLLPEPGAIAVGAPVVLGTREGSVAAVLPDGRVAVRWLDGEITDEALPRAIHRRA